MSDNGKTPPEPLPIGMQLGLGPNWVPGMGVGWKWFKIGHDHHVLLLGTATGTQGFSFDDEGLAAFIDAAKRHQIGLHLPPGP